MKKLFLVFLILTLTVGAFFLGRCTKKEATPPLSVYDCVTFYARIESIDGNRLLVEGLEVNDINTRSRFYLTVDESTRIYWHHTELTLSQLTVGDTVSITYTGLVQELYPANIVTPAVQILLLDDSL